MLNKMLKCRKKNSKGFSLVELIIVIAIMAILVGILAPQFIQYVEKSRQSTDVKNMQEIIGAIQVYCTDNKQAENTTGETFILSADGIKEGTTVIDTTDTATTTTLVGKAMFSAGLKAANCKAKSTKYTNGSIKVTIDKNGALTFVAGGTDDASKDLASALGF